jgi:hypothetical protein
MAFTMRALAEGLTRTPGSASGFAPWYARNRETLFRDAAGYAVFRQVKNFHAPAP